MGDSDERVIDSPAVAPPAYRGFGLGRRHLVLATALLLLVAACAGSREPTTTETASALPAGSVRFFNVVYDQMADKYVRPVSLSALATAGLGNLGKLDPKFTVARVGDRLEARKDGVLISAIDYPRQDDSQYWALATLSVVEAGRTSSPLLREASSETIYQTVVDGAMGQLDTFSRYLGQEAARESRAGRDGFGGIGITLDTEGGDVRVGSVVLESPAARGGVKIDDRIVRIEDETTVGMTPRDVVRRLRGRVGNPVRIHLTRAGIAESVQVTLVRALIVPPTVTYQRDGNIAHIRLSGFNHRTTLALSEAVHQARHEIGNKLEGLVLDLRGNLGGLLDQAISVSDFFLTRGQIVSTRGRHRASGQISEARRGDAGEDVPLVILINGLSASASEIVAAALQDNGRAVVIGTTSFGKGSVQTVIPLPNDGELILTWARFHAPTGYPLADLGVIPAICTSGGREGTDGVLAAVRDGRMTGPSVMADWRAADHNDLKRLKELREICPPETRERESDLEVAKRLLADRPLFARALRSAQLAAHPAP